MNSENKSNSRKSKSLEDDNDSKTYPPASLFDELLQAHASKIWETAMNAVTYHYVGVVSTTRILGLPEHALVGGINLTIYNKSLLNMSKEAYLPIRLSEASPHGDNEDWLWDITFEVPTTTDIAFSGSGTNTRCRQDFEAYYEALATIYKIPDIFSSELDTAFKDFGRRGAYELYSEIRNSLKYASTFVSTLELLRLPEYAFVSRTNLGIYNNFLLLMSERKWLPLHRSEPLELRQDENWLWEIKTHDE